MKYGLNDSREWSVKLTAAVWKRGNMEIETGIDLLSGAVDSFFGGYGRNDRGYVKGRYLF